MVLSCEMLSLEQVATHNSRDSCWVVIEGQVYDLTDFLEDHPGGASIILRYAGKVNTIRCRTNMARLTGSQDATEEYLPVHPPGTIEKELPTGDYTDR